MVHAQALGRLRPQRPAVDDGEPEDHDPPKVRDRPGNEPQPDGTRLYGVGGTSENGERTEPGSGKDDPGEPRQGGDAMNLAVPIVRSRPSGPFPWPVWPPPEAYTPEPPIEARQIVAPDGPTTTTVQGVLGSRTCGYSLRPTAEDLTEGLRRIDAGEPLDTVGYNAVTAWMHEADDREMVIAWLKGAYRLDSLVRAIFAVPIRRHDRTLATALCFPRPDWTGD